MSQHKASLLEAKQKSPLVVKSIDTQQPGDGEVLIKVEAAGRYFRGLWNCILDMNLLN